jgi:hypothetical protein
MDAIHPINQKKNQNQAMRQYRKCVIYGNNSDLKA